MNCCPLKKFLSFVAVMFFVTTLAGCTPQHTEISMEEAQRIIAENGDKVIILDVRTKEEYYKNHIPNAVLLPIEEIKEGNVESTLPDKNQQILVYCWTGRRAKDASKLLVHFGYKNVYSFGGLIDWTGEVEGDEVN